MVNAIHTIVFENMINRMSSQNLSLARLVFRKQPQKYLFDGKNVYVYKNMDITQLDYFSSLFFLRIINILKKKSKYLTKIRNQRTHRDWNSKEEQGSVRHSARTKKITWRYWKCRNKKVAGLARNAPSIWYFFLGDSGASVFHGCKLCCTYLFFTPSHVAAGSNQCRCLYR